MKAKEMKQKVKKSILYKDFKSVFTLKAYASLQWNTIVFYFWYGLVSVKSIFTSLFNLMILPIAHRFAFKDFKTTNKYDKLFEELSKKQKQNNTES